MRSLLLSAVFTILFCTISVGQQAYLDELAAKWDNASTYTLEIAEIMPDSAYMYRPTEEQRSFRAQLLHTAGNMIWLSQNYLGHKVDGFDFQARRELWDEGDLNKEQTIEELKFALDFARDAIASFDPEQLEETVEFFAGPMTKRQILMLLNDHHTHHRGQMIVYIRLKGLTPPRYSGW